MFNLYSTYSARRLLFFWPQQKVAQCSYTTLSALILLYIPCFWFLFLFLFFFVFLLLLLTSPRLLVECESSAWKLRHAWNLLCFMPHFLLLRPLCHASLSSAQLRLELHLLVCLCLVHSPSLLTLLSVFFLDVSAPYFFHFCIIKGRN